MSPLDPLAPLTFTPKQVCAALEIPHGTLNSWAHVGFLLGFDAELTQPGKARHYSFDDLMRLSLMKYLINLGLSIRRARNLSTLCYRFIKETNAGEIPRKIRFLMRMDGHSSLPLFDDDPIELPVGDLPPPVPVELVLYPSEILTEVMRRMEALRGNSE